MLKFMVFCIFFAVEGVALAHDVSTQSGSTHAKWNPDRLSFMPVDHVPKPSSTVQDRMTEYVVVLPNKWAQTQTIHVCFVGGSDVLHQKILKVAQTWIDHTNLKLDPGSADLNCKDKDKSEVRIGFAEPGYWSYIGHDSIRDDLVLKNLVSMNFEGFDVNPPAEPRMSGVILHEWGHALGLHHEHQSPAGGCDAEYDWTKLYAYYKSNYQWDKSTVDDNVRQLISDRSAYDWSNVDPRSIMIYGSNPAFLKKGTRSKCYFHDNNVLSALDFKGIEITYPKAAAEAALEMQQATLPVVLKLNLDKNLKDALAVQNDLAKRVSDPAKR